MSDVPLSEQQIRWMILGLVHEYGYVTFADITERLPVEKGLVDLELPGFPNLIVWLSLSEEVASAVTKLISSKKIFIHPATLMTYMMDGLALNLPVAKTVKTYKKRHWLPICFHHTKYKET